MKVKVFQMNQNGKIELTYEELMKLLKKAYLEGNKNRKNRFECYPHQPDERISYPNHSYPQYPNKPITWGQINDIFNYKEDYFDSNYYYPNKPFSANDNIDIELIIYTDVSDETNSNEGTDCCGQIKKEPESDLSTLLKELGY